jgi:hypothetical protein
MREMQWACVVVGVSLSFCGCGAKSDPPPSPPTPQAPSGLTYATPTAIYAAGTAITANAPTSSGGHVASYSVVPALPGGLSLDSGSGVISGTPTVATPKTNYTATASNAGGSSSATLTITVTEAAPSNLTYRNNQDHCSDEPTSTLSISD